MAEHEGVDERIARLIHREGPIAFDRFLEAALYDPEGGFFASGRGAGRAGADFVTSPHVGALFGACVARALDHLWSALDRPDPFVVVEAGAGDGRLVRDVLRAEPDARRALRYVLVERAAALRHAQREVVALEPADEALGPSIAGTGDDDPRPAPDAGPVVTSLPDLPAVEIEGVVFANELLDNLPFGIAQRRDDRWYEVRVTRVSVGFSEVLVPATDADVARLDAATAGIAIADGVRLPIPRGMEAWLDECGRVVRRGYVVLVDYVVDARDMVARGPEAWLRTYREHGAGTAPLTAPGSQDITADVMTEQLVHAARAAGFAVLDVRSQADWLRALGIDALVEEGRSTWHERAHLGDLPALAARSRVGEAEALLDAGGLGAHRVVLLGKGDVHAGWPG